MNKYLNVAKAFQIKEDIKWHEGNLKFLLERTKKYPDETLEGIEITKAILKDKREQLVELEVQEKWLI